MPVSLGDVLAVADVAERLRQLAKTCINRSKDLAAFKEFLENTAHVLLGLDAAIKGLPESHGLLDATLADIVRALDDCQSWMQQHTVFNAPRDKGKCAEVEECIRKSIPTVSVAGATFMIKQLDTAAAESKEQFEKLSDHMLTLEQMANWSGKRKREYYELQERRASEYHDLQMNQQLASARANADMHSKTLQTLVAGIRENKERHAFTVQVVKDGQKQNQEFHFTTHSKLDVLADLLSRFLAMSGGQVEGLEAALARVKVSPAASNST